jgi:hypothetical protein
MTQNQLLQDILNHLATNAEARQRFNKVALIQCKITKSILKFGIFPIINIQFEDSTTLVKQHIIQTALSNAPDGVAVLSFLNVPYFKSYDKLYFNLIYGKRTI